jgi:hypothetical protein
VRRANIDTALQYAWRLKRLFSRQFSAIAAEREETPQLRRARAIYLKF